jgi:putative hydroxymethylpyrimidine transport system permease protein
MASTSVVSNFVMARSHSLGRSGLTVVVAVATVALLWQTVVVVFRIPNYLLPSPWETVGTLSSQRLYLLRHSWWTVVEALAGLALAIAMGVVTASLVGRNRQTGGGLVSLMAAAQAVPVVAIAPLLTLWFGGGFGSKAVMAAALCYFPFTLALVRGLSQTPQPLIDLFRVHHAGRGTELLRLRVPVAIPSAMSGLRSSASLAMIGAIVAEYTGSDVGIGYVVMQATYRVDTTMVFAAVLAGATCGLGLYGAVGACEAIFLRRYYRGLDF